MIHKFAVTLALSLGLVSATAHAGEGIDTAAFFR